MIYYMYRVKRLLRNKTLFFWTILFFNAKEFLFSFVWLIVLWILILLTILSYKKTDKIAAYLQIPYLIWVTFAGYLNYMIYLLN